MFNAEQLGLLSDVDVIDHIFKHIDDGTTDLGETQWHEPVSSYYEQARFEREIALLRQRPVVFCPSSAIPDAGSYVARNAAGTPLLVARGQDKKVRAFINACRHRGMQVAAGQGCSRAFSCPYHGWTYNLDGTLKGLPGKAAFPDVDMAASGLVEVSAAEKGGLVYVMQQGDITDAMLEGAPDFFVERPNPVSPECDRG